MFPTAHIFGRVIGMYGLMIIIGAALAFLLGLTLKKLKRVPDKYGDFPNAFFSAVAGAIIGAVSLRPIMKIPEVVIHWDKYGQVTADILVKYIFGEIVFYGGLIGGFTAILLYCRLFKIRVLPLLDLGASAAALGHSAGRIGCLFGGCCYGKEVSGNNPLAVIYPSFSRYPAAPPNIPLLNIPVMECVFLLLLCAVLSVVFLRVKRDGVCVSLYLIIYSVWRFVIEYWRGDSARGVYGGISTSQYISLVLFAIGIAGIVRIMPAKNTSF